MSSLVSLGSRRIPPYVWVPVILASAVAGVFASKLRSVHPATPTSPIHRSEAPSARTVAAFPVDQSSTTVGALAAHPAIGPSPAAPISLPTEDLDLPTPAPKIANRPERPTGDTVEPAPPDHGRVRASIARDRALARARRPQRTAQQPAKPPSTASAGLKNVPIIGPVFSLFQ